MKSPVLAHLNATASGNNASAVKKLLSELEWSQAKLASKLSVAPNTVSRWLTGGLPVPAWLTEYLSAMLAVRRLACQFEVL